MWGIHQRSSKNVLFIVSFRYTTLRRRVFSANKIVFFHSFFAAKLDVLDASFLSVEPHEFNALSFLSSLHYQSICKDEKKAGEEKSRIMFTSFVTARNEARRKKSKKKNALTKIKISTVFLGMWVFFEAKCCECGDISTLLNWASLSSDTENLNYIHFNPIRLVHILTRLDVIVPFHTFTCFVVVLIMLSDW